MHQFINSLIQAKAMPTDLFKISLSLPGTLCEATVGQIPEDFQKPLYLTEKN